ncbi:unnamed protein product [Polarella glacialis]|uniref:Uncharacterized protein n=1 Tax=Polarella glacialis TaxID=89957 RepID=A0A813GS30_POLGL|nr:unnamed protein product [Polarella glacialis]CAE8682328.1 unnamed protein product [Polarella glacialis]|mmetsp:Transcript_65032/g.105138  ORF Transcript_65032/g.105138 Transcript_65032/m.105138 type:complete len:105 (-) Transcript_65032:78-392(-)
MMFRSGRVLGLFDNQFNKPGPLRESQKRRGIAWMWAMFSAPTFLVLVGNHPDVQEWFIQQYRPVEFPPQSDPQIIYDIFHGRTAKKSSLDSYQKETNRWAEPAE